MALRKINTRTLAALAVAGAPSSIKGLAIDFYATKVAQDDAENYHTTERYYFKTNGSYQARLNGRLDAAGNFDYSKTSHNTGRIICSSSSAGNVFSYIIVLEFKNSETGKWEATYQNDKLGTDAGTFTIIRQPN